VFECCHQGEEKRYRNWYLVYWYVCLSMAYCKSFASRLIQVGCSIIVRAELWIYHVQRTTSSFVGGTVHCF